MHPCLQIDEILRSIFEFLKEDPQGPQRRTLVNLAITCHTFSLPALAVLWSHLPSLAPVVMCLPCDAWGCTTKRASTRLALVIDLCYQ